jgi:hypothetical protein
MSCSAGPCSPELLSWGRRAVTVRPDRQASKSAVDSTLSDRRIRGERTHSRRYGRLVRCLVSLVVASGLAVMCAAAAVGPSGAFVRSSDGAMALASGTRAQFAVHCRWQVLVDDWKLAGAPVRSSIGGTVLPDQPGWDARHHVLAWRRDRSGCRNRPPCHRSRARSCIPMTYAECRG